MFVFYVLLILVLALAYPLCIKNPSKQKTIIYMAITFGAMWFISTFREGVGFDYQTYIDYFESYRTMNVGQIFEFGLGPDATVGQRIYAMLFSSTFEPGFMLLSKFMTLFIGSSVGMYGFYTGIILIPIGIFIYRQTKDNGDAWLSVWLYITMVFYFNNLNFIRQSIACAIAGLTYEFFIKKKPIPYVLLAILAASFHKTALILIPIYFIAHIPLTKITASIYVSVLFLTFIFSDNIINFAMNYAFTSYENSRYVLKVLGGTFMVVPLTVLIFGISLYPTWRKRNPVAGSLLNILILNATFWLFGSFKHMILERFSMYSYLFTIVILPDALRALKAGPEVHERIAVLEEDFSRRDKPQKHLVAELEGLKVKVVDHEKYYWSAVVALLLITFIYIYYGLHDGNFHNMTRYDSVLPWLSSLIEKVHG